MMNLPGRTCPRTLALAASTADATIHVVPEGNLVVNEVDYDQDGIDTLEFVEIFNVGTGLPIGVPRPVVKCVMCAPAVASDVIATPSLPGPSTMLRPGASSRPQ